MIRAAESERESKVIVAADRRERRARLQVPLLGQFFSSK
jgi:hypothetical protein